MFQTPQEIYGDLADSRWLRTFNENLVKVRETKGFVLQIQQGVLRDKSDMQVAEEMQSGWLQVPRIGFFAFPVTDIRGGNTMAEEIMDMAIKAARAQWTKGVAPDVEMVSPIFEPLEGELRFNARGGVDGLARVTSPSGDVYEGQHKGGLPHGPGTYTYADGDVLKGDYQNGLRHGPGTYTYADGDVAVLIFEEDRPKGPEVMLEKASGLFWLLKDGDAVQQISKAEAPELHFSHFVLLSGPGGGEGARPAGAPLVTPLQVMSALFSDRLWPQISPEFMQSELKKVVFGWRFDR